MDTLGTYLIIVAILDLSSRCAASIADTIAPSSAERSQVSSVTKNFLARLKNADGPFDTLTAIVCRGLSFCGVFVSSLSCSDESTELDPVCLVSNVDGVSGPCVVGLSAKLSDDSWSWAASVLDSGGGIVLDDCAAAGFRSGVNPMFVPSPLLVMLLPNETIVWPSRLY